MRERFGRSLGESEIVSAREVLVSAVYPPRRMKLFGSNDSKRFAQLVADEVLSAIAAREREVGGLDISSPREPCYQLGVLVVGVRSDPQNPHSLGRR